jgi:hypothetical protein
LFAARSARTSLRAPREPGGGAASEIRGQGELDPVIVPIGLISATAVPKMRQEALPDPAMYVFVFEADGYQSTEVAGTYGNLRPRPGGVGRSRFKYSLPTVTLRKSGASVTSNQAAGADRP